MDTKALRQKILDLAIRGKLVPQDPNDEPASVLLERIREQKLQMVKDGKLKKKDIKNDSIIFVGEDNLHYEKFADGSVKCIEEEIPFELPEGWSWARLQSITSILTDGTHKTPTYSEDGYIFLSSKNVTSGKIDWDNIMYIPESLHEELYNRIAPQMGDILLAKNGTTGVAAIVDKEEIFDIYVSLALIRIVENTINPLYILRAIGSTYVQDYFNSSLKGIGVPNLHLEHIRKTLLPIPPYLEQCKIVSRADILLPLAEQIEGDKKELTHLVSITKSKILDLAIRGQLVPQNPDDEPASVLLERIRVEKEELIKQGKIKRDKKESVIFRGEDNSYYEKIGDKVEDINTEIPFDLPEDWEFVRLKEIWELISGRDLSPSKYNADGIGVPYITGASNFNNDKVDLVRWTPNPQVITEFGDLLITCKGTIGEIAFNDFGEAHIARQIMAIRNIYSLNSEYLSLCISFYISKIKSSAKGLIPGISREDILNIMLPVPPEAYQSKIVLCVKELNRMLLSIEKSLLK